MATSTASVLVLCGFIAGTRIRQLHREKTRALQHRRPRKRAVPRSGRRRKVVLPAAAASEGYSASPLVALEALFGDSTFVQDRAFAGLKQFNCDEGRRQSGQRHRLSCTRLGVAGNSNKDTSASAAHKKAGKQHGVDAVSRWFSASGSGAASADSLPSQLAHALARRRAIDLKEFCEAFEFFTRVRRSMRLTVTEAPTPGVAATRTPTRCIVDLCCGHGLTGILFAMFERSVEQVLLVDAREPAAHRAILDAACEVAPHVREKVTFCACTLDQFLEAQASSLEAGAESEAPGEGDGHGSAHREQLPPLLLSTGLLAVHACGDATDRCIDIALRLRGNIALMPCCYRPRHRGSRARSQQVDNKGRLRNSNSNDEGAQVLEGVLGRGMHADVLRTQRLYNAGFDVEWTAIPRCITNKNRVIVARYGRGQ